MTLVFTLLSGAIIKERSTKSQHYSVLCVELLEVSERDKNKVSLPPKNIYCTYSRCTF